MSVEEDTELKNLVAQTLENKGILPKIRAELRANVFLALEENPTTKDILLKNDQLSHFLKIPVASLVLNLIREFLEFFELDFTLSVFDPETKYGKEYSNLTREKMMKELKITDSNLKCPLLYEIIERIFNMDRKGFINEHRDLSQGDVSVTCDNGNIFSPIPGLNSTYIKGKPELGSLPLSPVDDEKSNDEEESIKEELVSNNVSETENLPPQLDLDLSPKHEDRENNSVECNSENTKEVSSPLPKDPVEVDLLIFTPVKESKPKEKSNTTEVHINNEVKTDNTKGKQHSTSILGDLPPLSLKTEERGNKINEIKAMIDGWPNSENDDESSIGSKSNREIFEDNLSTPRTDRSHNANVASQKSDQTEIGEEYEDDISDLINGHTPSDGQLTVDETISKVSNAGDYVESI